MGLIPSTLYGHLRRLAIRYNAENRAHKFLEKGHLPVAPRHRTSEEKTRGKMLTKEQLEDIHCKNKQLDEHLKKVYLTSTSTITGTPSKRPKPKKENEVFMKKMFYEPETPSPGHCTLTNVVKMLTNYQKNSDITHIISSIAFEYKLNKKDVGNLLFYHSIFALEKFDFINAKPKESVSDEPEPEPTKFEIFNRLEKKPLRQIPSGSKQ